MKQNHKGSRRGNEHTKGECISDATMWQTKCTKRK